MKKGVFGVTDSMSKFTGSVGKGISAATMDQKYRDRRRNAMVRNRPTHAMYGLTSGVTGFGISIASGFAGLVVCEFISLLN
jgi:vacuolar protein sorting-associated protein 13A/C